MPSAKCNGSRLKIPVKDGRVGRLRVYETVLGFAPTSKGPGIAEQSLILICYAKKATWKNFKRILKNVVQLSNQQSTMFRNIVGFQVIRPWVVYLILCHSYTIYSICPIMKYQTVK
jgi:hypothetical protein